MLGHACAGGQQSSGGADGCFRLQMLDATIEIPQVGVIRSLNAHVSGAVALYEHQRQTVLVQD